MARDTVTATAMVTAIATEPVATVVDTDTRGEAILQRPLAVTIPLLFTAPATLPLVPHPVVTADLAQSRQPLRPLRRDLHGQPLALFRSRPHGPTRAAGVLSVSGLRQECHGSHSRFAVRWNRTCGGLPRQPCPPHRFTARRMKFRVLPLFRSRVLPEISWATTRCP